MFHSVSREAATFEKAVRRRHGVTMEADFKQAQSLKSVRKRLRYSVDEMCRLIEWAVLIGYDGVPKPWDIERLRPDYEVWRSETAALRFDIAIDVGCACVAADRRGL